MLNASSVATTSKCCFSQPTRCVNAVGGHFVGAKTKIKKEHFEKKITVWIDRLYGV